MTEKIYILLPVHNRRDMTRRFIECLRIQTFRQYHLVLIDDGSKDGTEEMVRKLISSITTLKGYGNWWWAGSLQHGYEWLKSQNLPLNDVVLIINDDTNFEADFLEKAMYLLRKYSKTLLLAQCYNQKTRELIDAGVHVDWRKLAFERVAIPEEINCLSTRGLFLRVSDFFEIGGFYPRLLPHYLSDYEFTIRAQRKGMKLMTDPLLRLWLDEDATGYRQFKNGSFIDFLKKYFSKKSALNPLILTIFIALACPWQWKFPNWLRVWKGAVYQMIGFLRAALRKPIKVNLNEPHS